MADISKIKLPSGSEYNIKDASALHSSDVVSTYSSTGTAPVNGTAVAAALATLPEPMVFKGTLGTGGTITALPVDGSAKVGDTYKVITAGTYASQAAKVGDVFICQTKTSSANTWAYVPAGDETDSDTWRNIKVNGTEKLGNAISTGGVDFVNGTNTTVSFNATGNKISINATDTTYSAATQSTDGLMSSTDKTKLDGIAAGATANVGTITGITMNGASKGTSGVVDLGTVITAHQDISGKADKSATVSNVTYDTTNKKFKKTINGTTSDIATVATTDIPNVTSAGSVTAGVAASLTKSDVTIPNVTSAGSMPTYTVSDEMLTITAGAAPTLGTAITATQITAWTTNTPTAVTAPTLGTAIKAVTGFTTT